MKSKEVKSNEQIKWLDQPESQDYPAAHSYLSLVFADAESRKYIAQLRKASVVQYKAKDIFRASTLSLLGISNKHVKRDLKKIQNNTALSPLLLVRNSTTGKVIIADGYHRLCAVYSMDEDALIPCKIV